MKSSRILLLTAVLLILMTPAPAFAKASRHILLTETSTYDLTENFDHLKESTFCSYDNSGRTTMSTTLLPTGYRTDGHIRTMDKTVTRTTYGKTGLAQTEILRKNNSLSQRSTYIYKGKKLKKIQLETYNAKKKKWRKGGYISCSVTKSRERFRTYTKGGQLVETRTLFKDAKGRLTRDVWRHKVTGAFSDHKWSYDKKGNVTVESSVTRTPGGDRTEIYITRTFDKYGKALTESVNTNGATVNYRFKYEGGYYNNKKKYPLERTAYSGGKAVLRTVYHYTIRTY